MRLPLKLAILPLLTAAIGAAADKAPQWLAEIATRETPAYEDVVSAVVLFEEEKSTVSPDGVVTASVRKAIKILSRAGRSEAAARAVYRTDSSKVRRLDAWTIYPSGQVKAYGKRDVADLSLADNDVYNEARLKFVSGSSDSDPGAVFGYESVIEDRSIFTQFSYRFQDDLPTLTSRFVLELPSGWTAKAVTFNSDTIEPQVDGSRYVWQLDRLGPIVDEAASPRLTSLVPRIAVSYFPQAGSEGATGPSFESWSQVSSWLATLSDPQATADQAIESKTRELVADAPTAFDRIDAIGRYAQDIKYVSIQIGVGSGGGYQPHPASEVFAKSYGDCKDKATLMRSMLSTLGIESYPLTVYSRDPQYVNSSWPSPRQFNHAIIAVAAPQGYEGSAVVDHERYGRLLIFDPTDPYTPPGELREALQGGYGLLVDAAGGDLFRLPSSPPSANLVRREIVLDLTPDGSISGSIVEESNGEAAARERRSREALSQADYRRNLELWLTNQASSAALADFKVVEPDAGRFDLNLQFEAQRYGRTMGTKVLIFEPAVVSRRGLRYPIDEDRRYPVVLRSQAFDETVRVRLPEGFAVDELPPPLELETDFGTYRAQCEVEDGELRFARRLEIKNAEIPAERYSEVREFFGRIGALEQTPVVLIRQ